MKIVIPLDEYKLLRRIAVLAILDDEDAEEQRKEAAYRHMREYDMPVIEPEPTAIVENDKAYDNASLIANAEVTANRLMATGMNGPRLGGFPIGPSNLMCEGSATIRAFLERIGNDRQD